MTYLLDIRSQDIALLSLCLASTNLSDEFVELLTVQNALAFAL